MRGSDYGENRLLEHGAATRDRKELLGVVFSGERPQARTGPTGKDDRIQSHLHLLRYGQIGIIARGSAGAEGTPGSGIALTVSHQLGIPPRTEKL